LEPDVPGWTRSKLVEDLRELRVQPGEAVLVHASMRAIGKVEGGADGLLEALCEAVGPDGTICTPAFNSANRIKPGSASTNAQAFVDGVDERNAGVLAARLAGRPDSLRSLHPTLSFAALGRQAEFLTTAAPFHYPLGSGSPLARLHQLNARVLLIGVGHEANSTLHLAETWADAPYARRRATVVMPDGAARDMEGSPECSAGFARVEPVLRQARIVRSGAVGYAPAQSMLLRHVVSMAVEMLQGNPEFLLCDRPSCEACTAARRFTAAPSPID
jgi:aminoglycoside N3'-acetyltransferase